MSKRIAFSVVLESTKLIEIGSAIDYQGKMIVVTSLRKVEYITERLVLVSGTGTV